MMGVNSKKKKPLNNALSNQHSVSKRRCLYEDPALSNKQINQSRSRI